MGDAIELPAEVKEGLVRVGIGRRYFTSSLRDKGEIGQNLAEWAVSKSLKADIRKGLGRAVHGDGVMAMDTFMLLARALFLRGIPVRVLQLSKLAMMLDKDQEDEALESASAVFIASIFTEGYRSMPLPDHQRILVEAFIKDHLIHGGALFTLADKAMDSFTEWWSATLVKLLKTHNEDLEVLG